MGKNNEFTFENIKLCMIHRIQNIQKPVGHKFFPNWQVPAYKLQVSPLSEEHYYETFHMPKWCKAEKQLPLIYTEIFSSISRPKKQCFS